MTSPQFARALMDCDTLLLPLASIEQGGRHCPLGSDLIAADAVSRLIAEKADCLVAPTMPYGDTLELDSGPGTIDVGTAVFAAYVEAVAASFLRQGFRNIVFLCCHSLDLRAVDKLCRSLRMQGYGVGAIDWWKAVGEAANGQTESAPFGHCGEVITSAMLALAPGWVDLASAEEEAPLPALSFVAAHGPGIGVHRLRRFPRLLPLGRLGRGPGQWRPPTRAVPGSTARSPMRRSFIVELRAALPPGRRDER